MLSLQGTFCLLSTSALKTVCLWKLSSYVIHVMRCIPCSCEMTKMTRASARVNDRHMGDVNLDNFWNADADKYKCCCRTFHVVRASLFIAYAQMLITFVFALFFTFYYVQVSCILYDRSTFHTNKYCNFHQWPKIAEK